MNGRTGNAKNKAARKNAPAEANLVLPADLDAERSVLAAILFDNHVCGVAVNALTPKDFHRKTHRLVFAAMSELHREHGLIDPPTIAGRIKDKIERNDPEYSSHDINIDFNFFISELIDVYAVPENIESYVKTVKTKALLREAVFAAHRALKACEDPYEPTERILKRLQTDIHAVGQRRLRQGFRHVAEYARIQLRKAEDGAAAQTIPGIPTGFTDLDRLTNGLHPGQLIVVAARPAMGKTAFALNVAYQVAAAGKTVGFFSLEMSKEAVARRLLAAESRIPAQRLFSGLLSADERRRLTTTVAAVAEAKLFVNDASCLTTDAIHAEARRVKDESGLDLLVVDYLQLIAPRRRGENRQAEVAQISRDLKTIARDLAVPVMALAQINRAAETRADHRPLLSDLRESGGIEQDADVVAFLYREAVYNPETENPGKTELIIAKQRNGPSGVARLVFIDAYTRFENEWEEDFQ